MQIACPNCRKNFFVKDELIPTEGRNLQCGKCFNKWFFNYPTNKKNIDVKKVDKTHIEPTKFNNVEINEEITKNKTKEFNFKDNKKEKEIDKKENKVNIFKLILVIIITFIAVIIAIETFKNQISIFFPDIIVILDNLFQSLHDIQLFIKDLVK